MLSQTCLILLGCLQYWSPCDLMRCMEEQLRELRSLAAKAQNRLTDTGIPRVAMVQGKIPEHELSAVYEPMVNLILQGSKSITVGEQTLHYDPATYFVMSIDLPAMGAVRPASTGEPYLAVALTLAPSILADRTPERPTAPSPTTATVSP